MTATSDMSALKTQAFPEYIELIGTRQAGRN
jgi:hypothetical protein